MLYKFPDSSLIDRDFIPGSIFRIRIYILSHLTVFALFVDNHSLFSASLIIHCRSVTTFLRQPIPSILRSTTSPSLRNVGGVIPIPTPAGVPVAMTVPA